MSSKRSRPGCGAVTEPRPTTTSPTSWPPATPARSPARSSALGAGLVRLVARDPDGGPRYAITDDGELLVTEVDND
jgi:hypothetical protein